MSDETFHTPWLTLKETMRHTKGATQPVGTIYNSVYLLILLFQHTASSTCSAAHVDSSVTPAVDKFQDRSFKCTFQLGLIKVGMNDCQSIESTENIYR